MKRSAYISLIEPNADKVAEIERFLKAGSDNFLFTVAHFDSFTDFEKHGLSSKSDAIISSDAKMGSKSKVQPYAAIPFIVLGDEKPILNNSFSHADFLIYNKLNLYHLPKMLDKLISDIDTAQGFSNNSITSIDNSFVSFDMLPMAAFVFEGEKLVYSNSLSRPYLNASLFVAISQLLKSSDGSHSLVFKGVQYTVNKKSKAEQTYLFVVEEHDQSTQMLSAFTKMTDDICLLVFKDNKLVFKNEKANLLVQDAAIFVSFEQLFEITISSKNTPQIKHKSSGLFYDFSIEEMQSPNGKFELVAIKNSEPTSLPVNLQEALISALSHDVKEPLRTSTSYTQLLASKLEDKEQIEYAEIISKELKRLDNLLQNIRQVFTPSAMQVRKQSVSLRSIVEASLKELKNVIDEVDAIVDLSKMPDVNADKVKLTQVFRHLIENAVRYRKEDKRCLLRLSLPIARLMCWFV
jgi:two-component sensor histidine kinase